MKYDFITVLDRTGADSIAANIDPWGVSPAPAQRIPMWVADMSFPTAPPILEAMHKRLAFPNFGYFSMPDEYFDCILRWQETRNGLTWRRQLGRAGPDRPRRGRAAARPGLHRLYPCSG